MKNFKMIFVPTIALFAICLVATTLLGVTNFVTAPKIAESASQAEVETRKKVLESADKFEESKDGKYVKGLDKDGKAVGYVFTTEAKGYGGAIKVMTGVDKEGKVAGVQILELAETPGLGMNATAKPDFLPQFIGKVKGIGVAKSNPGENDIQALTSATITSTAVTNAVNEALDSFETIKEAE